MYEIMIGSGDQFLTIVVTEKKYPNCHDSWDGGWLNSKLKLSIGEFRCISRADLRVDEFESFLKGLKRLERKPKGMAEFRSIEDWLSIRIESADSLGHFRARIVVKDSLEGENEFTGLILFDQISLRKIVLEVESVIAEF